MEQPVDDGEWGRTVISGGMWSAEHGADASGNVMAEPETSARSPAASGWKRGMPDKTRESEIADTSVTARERARWFKTPRDEILALREDVEVMERRVQHLRRKRHKALGQFGRWKALAYEQSGKRLAAMQENKKLRQALHECRQLTASLFQIMQQPMPYAQALVSTEENEWRMNMLGFHPMRRHENAVRIMGHMRRRLSGWAITSGLVEGACDTHFSRCENKELTDRPMLLEVGLCRRLDGHYRDIADAVWRYLTRSELETRAGTSVRIQTSEILSGHIRYNVSGFRMTVDGRQVDHTTQHLCEYIEENNRILIMWKQVIDNCHAKTHQFTENADGWITVEKSYDGDRFLECCVLKSSSIAHILPIDASDRASSGYLLTLLRRMNLAPHTSPVPVERLRHAFADLILDTLWRHVRHVEQLARHSSVAISV